MSDAEATNREFYDQLYRPRSAAVHLIRALVSFDQRSKAAPNLRMLSSVFIAHQKLGGQAEIPRRLLDYGCGWGTLLLTMKHREIELYGYDLSPDAVTGVAKAGTLLGKRVANPPRNDQNEIRSDYFDVVVCSHVLEHVAEDEALLRTFHRVLRHNGHLLLNVPINELVPDAKHVHGYTEKLILEKVKAAGFDILRTATVDRWTGLLLSRSHDAGPVRRAAIRGLRGLLALFPWPAVEWTGERLLQKGYPHQQFLVLARVAPLGA